MDQVMRDSDSNILPAASAAIGGTLDAILSARAFLKAELLADAVEARAFGVTPDNVADVLEARLQLLERARAAMRSGSTSIGVNEQPLEVLGLTSSDLWKGYIPLAQMLRERMAAHRAGGSGAFAIGINAPPGSGKSTLVQVLLFLMTLGEEGLRAVQLSSDDLYMSKTARDAAGIPTRLDPRSLDPALHGIVRRLKHATARDTVELPRFNKGTDDREKDPTVVNGPFDIVMYEGWRVGVKSGELFGNAFNYSELNEPIDFLLYLDAHAEHTWSWKLASSRRDHEREHDEPWTAAHETSLRKVWERWMRTFLEQHEKPLTGTADLVLSKDHTHHVLRIDVATRRRGLRRMYDGPSSSSRPSLSLDAAAEMLEAAFGRGKLGLGLLLRKQEGSDNDTDVSFDHFADVAEVLAESSGALPVRGLHRFLGFSTARVCKDDDEYDQPFTCASVAAQDIQSTCARLREDLGGVPSAVVAYAPTAAGLEEAVAAVASAFPECRCIHGCTTAHGSISSGESGECTLFGIRDVAGAYGVGGVALDTDEPAAWEAAAVLAVRQAVTAAGQDELAIDLPSPLIMLHATPGHEESVLAGIASVLPGANVFGGSAADAAFDASAWRVAADGICLGTPAVSIALYWPSVSYSLSLTCLHDAPAQVEASSVKVTNVERSGRHLITLDGEPAAVAYDRLCDMTGSSVQGDRSSAPDTRTTLHPLARRVQASDGARYFPLHPRYIDDAHDALDLFASATEGEELVLLTGTREGLVTAAGAAASRTRAELEQSGNPEIAGALAIYCAGCAFELLRGDGAGALRGVGEAIRTALGSGCPPFACGFTFGEQGPLLVDGGNTHANLMFSLLVFGAKR